MTAAITADAVSHNLINWHAIGWQKAHENVCRLQARIVKATQAGKWRKVKALQRLLPHSFSGKALAVKRVTENQGKRTPGVDGEIWDTPAKRAAAIHSLNCCEAASCEWRLKGLRGRKGNFHVPCLGELGAAMPPAYPTIPR